MQRDPILEWATSDGASSASLAGDAVSEALDQLRIEGWFAGISRLSHPMGVEIPVAGGGFFAMLSGSVIFDLQPGNIRLDLHEGDLLIVLRGDRFTIRTGEDAQARPIMEILEPAHVRRHQGIVNGGGPIAAEHIGAAIRFSGPHDSLVRNALPPALLVRWDTPEQSSLSHCVQWLRDQEQIANPGERATVNRHIALIVVETIRQHLAAGSPASGYIQALGDPHIGPVLGLMRSRLGHDWSIETLALESGLSRSGFHERFQSLLGISPASHLRELRMNAAKDLLRTTGMSVKQMGCSLGYGSDTAFGAAFKRSFGVSPSSWRKRQSQRRAD